MYSFLRLHNDNDLLPHNMASTTPTWSYVGSGSGGGDVISGGGGSEKLCLSWYVGFLLTHFCCAFLSVVLSEEQKQNVNMFVDPVNKFFQVWCVCACVRACLCMHNSFYFSVYIGSQ